MIDFTTIFLGILQNNMSKKNFVDINRYLNNNDLIVTKRSDYEKLCKLREAIEDIVDDVNYVKRLKL